jgi:putative hydrolase of HD superfamily
VTWDDAITTETGKRLAAAAQELGPEVWWAEFAASYGRSSAMQ